MRDLRAVVRCLELTADLCILSVLALAACLPLVTVGASCAALYHAAVRCLRQDRGTPAAVFRDAFRSDFRQCLPLSLLFFAGAALVAADILLGLGISQESGLFLAYWVTVAALGALVAGTALYAFALASRFRQRTGPLVRSAFLLAVGYPVKTLALLALCALTVWLIRWFPPLLLIAPGLCAWISSFVLEPVLEKHGAPEGRSAPEEK